MTNDQYLLSGHGGPHDDDLPVQCSACGGTGLNRWKRCEVCRGTGMIDRAQAEKMLREKPEIDSDYDD